MYRLFYDGQEPPKPPPATVQKSDEVAWGRSGKDAEYFGKLRRLLAKTTENDRKLILYAAQKMAK